MNLSAQRYPRLHVCLLTAFSFVCQCPPASAQEIAANNLSGDVTVKTEPPSSKPLENAELKDYVDVRSFGAKGDDRTDDTAAIQAAINHACFNGKRVHLPAGKYLVSDSLVPTTLAGEKFIKTLVITGDGGTFKWDGAGTQIKINPTLKVFPKGVLVLSGSRFVDIRGIRFVGLSQNDTGSSAVHYNNANQGAKFSNCGFQNFESAIKIGNPGMANPYNDDFCKYDFCEFINAQYAFSIHGTESYHHKVTRSMLSDVGFVMRAFADARQTSMNSFSISDSFIDVKDTAFHIEGNPRSILECRNNLFEVDDEVIDQPRLYVQAGGTGMYTGTAIFDGNQFNWSGFGTTSRVFIEVFGSGNVTFSNNKVEVYRPIIYSKCGDPDINPMLSLNNEWSNRPSFFQDKSLVSGGQVVRLGDRHRHGQSLIQKDANGSTNVGQRAVLGLEVGSRRIAWLGATKEPNLGTGSILLGKTPARAGTPAIEWVLGERSSTTPTTTCNTKAGFPEITVVSPNGLYLGGRVFIAGIGNRIITEIKGNALTLDRTSDVESIGAELFLNEPRKAGLYLAETETPNFPAGAGSIAIHIGAKPGETSIWINPAEGRSWVAAGTVNMNRASAVPDSGAEDLASLRADYNHLLSQLRNANLIAR